MVIRGSSYDCCSACSDKIINAYQTDGWQFVKRALNEKGYVEDLSGLTEVCSELTCHLYVAYMIQVQRTAEKALAEMEISDEGEMTEE